MTKLNQIQKDFIIEEFFDTPAVGGRGRGIANTLLDEGKCIVAGEKPLWLGGIGNFIETEKPKGSFGCLLYTFDLDYFLASKIVKEYWDDKIIQLLIKKEKAEKDFNEMANLFPTDVFFKEHPSF